MKKYYYFEKTSKEYWIGSKFIRQEESQIRLLADSSVFSDHLDEWYNVLHDHEFENNDTTCKFDVIKEFMSSKGYTLIDEAEARKLRILL